MVDPLSYFSFQPVLHDWYNKGRGMCYPVCGMMHIKEPLLLIGKSSPCGGSGFPLSLSGGVVCFIRPRPARVPSKFLSFFFSFFFSDFVKAGHNFDFRINDTECNRGTGLYTFVEMVKQQNTNRSNEVNAVIGNCILQSPFE